MATIRVTWFGCPVSMRSTLVLSVTWWVTSWLWQQPTTHLALSVSRAFSCSRREGRCRRPRRRCRCNPHPRCSWCSCSTRWPSGAEDGTCRRRRGRGRGWRNVGGAWREDWLAGNPAYNHPLSRNGHTSFRHSYRPSAGAGAASRRMNSSAFGGGSGRIGSIPSLEETKMVK